MKVFLLGATGNLGSRLVPALLTHGHTVVTYVRSSKKLESLLPASVFQQVTVVEGNATDSTSIKRAILDSGSEAVVNSAGIAAAAPWATNEFPVIFQAVLTAVQEAGKERNKPLRTWFLGGLGALNYPGTDTMLCDYLPIYVAHRKHIQLLRSLPPNTVEWTMLCPSMMVPESTDLITPTKSTKGKLVVNATTPPQWKHSWVQSIPLIGKTLDMVANANRYNTTLEQNAELIASDLETYESRYSGFAVGVIDPAN